MSRLEDVRVGMGYYPSAPFNHNSAKRFAENHRRLGGDRRSKGYKAEQQRARDEKFLQEFPQVQLKRSLDHMFDGTATPEDIDYVFRHIDELRSRVIVVRPPIATLSKNVKI